MALHSVCRERVSFKMANYSGKGGMANGSIYVCNLPPGTDENMLAEFFGTIGLLKVGS